ncbi:MAG TPA: hypothetical protein PKM57_02160 [Kiritimatiellia bacterium]|nr:hypothetical protein [Kiritimatiellia bacterium]HPS09662.1 hypothetical protein [Kiritimatiellia bacterium]
MDDSDPDIDSDLEGEKTVGMGWLRKERGRSCRNQKTEISSGAWSSNAETRNRQGGLAETAAETHARLSFTNPQLRSMIPFPILQLCGRHTYFYFCSSTPA